MLSTIKTAFCVLLLSFVSVAQITSTVKIQGAQTVGNQFTVTTSLLPNGQVGVAYANQTLTSSGGIGSITWAVTNGTLPPGLTMSSGGIISGTPSSNGNSTFTVTATDSQSHTAGQTFTVTIIPAVLAITSTSPLPDATQNTAYSTTISATGGIAPYTWTVSAGTLPNGMSLGSSSGTISGTDGTAETQTFTIQVSDSQTIPFIATASFSLTVDSSVVTVLCGNSAASNGTLAQNGTGKIFLVACTTGANTAGYTVNSANVEFGTSVSGSVEAAVYDSGVANLLCTVGAGQAVTAGVNTLALSTQGCNDAGNTGNSGIGLSPNTTYKIAFIYSAPEDLRLTTAGTTCTGATGVSAMFGTYNVNPATTFPANSTGNQPFSSTCAFRVYLNLTQAGGSPPVANLASVTMSPASVQGGVANSTGTVTLDNPAPAGGAVVTLSSSNTSAATVPASVTVLAGGTTATFTATTSTVANNTTSTIQGTYNSVNKTALLTITAAPVVTLTGLSLNPTTVTGGVSSVGTVTLSASAPSGGEVVSLASSNVAAATVPASVTVPAGQSSATFTITTFVVFSNASSIISANFASTTLNATLTVNSSSVGNGPLRVSSINPIWLTDNSGKAIYLAGSHTWNNDQDKGLTAPPPVFNYTNYMTFMASHKFNWMRLWVWMFSNGNSTGATGGEQFDPFVGPYWPWQRIGPGTANDGNLKTDFNSPDPNYYQRMQQRVSQAAQNSPPVYVTVMLFDAFEFNLENGSADGNPFNSANNVNSISASGNTPTTCSDSTCSSMNAALNAVEVAYIEKVIDTVNGFDNVVGYEVANEPGSGSDAWQQWVTNCIHNYESGAASGPCSGGAAKAKQHLVLMNGASADSVLYSSTADMVSPFNATPSPGTCPGSTCKVTMADTDHECNYTCLISLGNTGQMERMWENFMRGDNVAFMDPYVTVWGGSPPRNCPANTETLAASGCTNLTNGQSATPDVFWDNIRNAMSDVRTYASKVDLINMKPGVCQIFCLQEPGIQYLIFSTSTTYTVTMTAGNYSVEWFNPTTHAVVQDTTISATTSQSFTAPFSGDNVLWLVKSVAISSVASSNVTSSSATITWTTDQPATSRVEYGTTTSYGSFFPASGYDTNTVTSHSETVTSLASSQLYHYRVHSVGANGADVVSGDNTFTTAAPAAPGTPFLAFTDLASGPATGNSDTTFSTGNGAYVSVWGTNLGITAGTATVNGVNAPIVFWGNATCVDTSGHCWSPANLNNGYQQMQIVILQVPSTAPTGGCTATTNPDNNNCVAGQGIQVTVSGKTSNIVPFTVTSAGRIFFASSAGTNGSGTFASPFNSIIAGKNAANQAGDILYVENNTPVGTDSTCIGVAMVCLLGNQALVSYPGAVSKIGLTGADVGNANGSNAGSSGISDKTSNSQLHPGNTVAKFNLRAGLNAVQNWAGEGRWVGNNITAPNLNSDTGGFYINGSNVYILGDEIYQVGLLCTSEGGTGLCGTTGNPADARTFAHVFYSTAPRGTNTPVEMSNRHFEWLYMHDGLNGASMAVHNFQDEGENGSACCADVIKDFVVAHNVIVDQYHAAINFSGVTGTAYVFDNLLINTGQGTGATNNTDTDVPGFYIGIRLGGPLPCANMGGLPASDCAPPVYHVYNNTIWKTGCPKNGSGNFCGNATITTNGNMGCFFTFGTLDIHNNICVQTDITLPYYATAGGPQLPTTSAQSSNNLWFTSAGLNNQAVPTWDNAVVTSDPTFTATGTSTPTSGSSGGNFRLQSSSPAIDAGSNLGAGFVVNDLDGNPQPSGNAYDLGPYETAGGSTSNVVISNVAASGITTTVATITWTTNVGASSQVEYMNNGTGLTCGAASFGASSLFTPTSPDTTQVTSHSESLASLNPSTCYWFRVHSAGSNGIDVTSPAASFNTTAVGNIVISAVSVSGITASGATVNWTTNQADAGTAAAFVSYGTTTAYGAQTTAQRCTTSTGCTFAQAITGLQASTLYHYQISSTGTNGVVVTTADATFTTAVVGNVSITNVTALPVSNTSETVSWSVSQNVTNAFVKYGTTTAYGSQTTATTCTSTSGCSQTISGLTAGTLYHYQVSSTGTNGIAVTSADFTFTTTGSGNLPQGWTRLGPSTDKNSSSLFGSGQCVDSTNGFNGVTGHSGNCGTGSCSPCDTNWCDQLIDAWSGGTLRTGSTPPQFLAWGGGHATYGGDDLYGVSPTFPNATWQRLVNPVAPGACGCGVPVPAAVGDVIPISGWPSACASPAYPTAGTANGTGPTSRHSYGGVTYIPAGADASGTNPEELFVGGGATITGSGGSPNDFWEEPIPGTVPGTPNWTFVASGTGAASANYEAVVFVPSLKVVVALIDNGISVINPSTTTAVSLPAALGGSLPPSTWRSVASKDQLGSLGNATVDTVNNLVVAYAASSQNNGAAGVLLEFNLSTAAVTEYCTFAEHSFCNATLIPSCPDPATMNSQSPGITFDTSLGKPVIRADQTGGTIYIWDHASKTCSSETYGGSVPTNSPSGISRGMYGHFHYIPSKGYYIYLVDGFSPPYILCRNSGGCTP